MVVERELSVQYLFECELVTRILSEVSSFILEVTTPGFQHRIMLIIQMNFVLICNSPSNENHASKMPPTALQSLSVRVKHAGL